MVVGFGRGPVVMPFLVCVLVGTLLTGFKIWQEWRRVPTLLRYWVEGSDFALTVRSIRSGEVLLRSVGESLAGFELSDTKLAGASLTGVNLQAAIMERADLRSADLRNCRLVDAVLEGADLRGANLERSDLRGANFRNADLRHARLPGAVLDNTDFRAADLRGADFAGRGAGRVIWLHSVGNARLTGAQYDATTHWPPGFDPRAKGCVYIEDTSAGLPIPTEAQTAHTTQLPIPTGNGAATIQAIGGDHESVQQLRI
jgi:hypothetical protein